MERFREFKNDEYAHNGNMSEGLSFEEIMELFNDSDKAFEWCHKAVNRKAYLDMLEEMSNFTKGIYGSYWYITKGAPNSNNFDDLDDFKYQWKYEWDRAVRRYDFPQLLKKAHKQDPVMYRAVNINEGEGGKVDYKHPGHCWAFKKQGAYNFKGTSLSTEDGWKVVYLKGSTPWDNIDWVKSVLLTCTIYNDEMEFRVVDDSKITLIVDTPESKEEARKRKEEARIAREEKSFRKCLIDNGDGTFDFQGDLLALSYKVLFTKKGIPVKLRKVMGNLCLNLEDDIANGTTNLPQEVTGNLMCWLRLKSFDDLPKAVGGDVSVCCGKDIKSLSGLPREVNGNLSLNGAYTLEGCPPRVEGSLYLNNYSGWDLKGCPEHIGGELNIMDSTLESLEGMTQDVGSICLGVLHYIKDFKGCPQKVNGDFCAYACGGDNEGKISLEGVPREVGGSFDVRQLNCGSYDNLPSKVGKNLKLFRVSREKPSMNEIKCEVGGVIVWGNEVL